MYVYVMNMHLCVYVCMCLVRNASTCIFQTLDDPELEAQLGKIRDSAPKHSLWTKVKVIQMVILCTICVYVHVARVHEIVHVHVIISRCL